MLERREVTNLREKLNAELKIIGEKLGWKLTLGAGKYSETVTFKLEASPIKEGGEAETREAINFRRLAHLYLLKPEDLGRTFSSRGALFEIVGLNDRAHKMPILAKKNGKVYKFSAEVVKEALDMKKSS